MLVACAAMARLALLGLALVLLGCNSPDEPEGLSTAAICQELAAQQAESDSGDSEARLAERNRAMAERLLPVAELAQDAENPDLAALGERLEFHARSVLDRLESDATDEQARLVAEPMLRESVLLHSGCISHLSDPDER